MIFANPHRPRHPHSKPMRRRAVVVSATAGLMALVGAQAFGADTPGETFLFDWTETSGSNVGLTGTVDLTLGPASSKSGFFDVSTFDVTEAGGFCGICTPKSENLSGLLFDATTGGLVGDVTGSFINTKGKTHTFNLLIADLPAGTWTFDNTGPNGSTTSMGSYKTVAAVKSVDEPGTWLLLIPAAAGLLLSRGRRPNRLTA